MNLFVVSPHCPGDAHRLVDLKQKGLFLADSEELQSVCSRLEQKAALHCLPISQNVKSAFGLVPVLSEKELSSSYWC